MKINFARVCIVIKMFPAPSSVLYSYVIPA